MCLETVGNPTDNHSLTFITPNTLRVRSMAVGRFQCNSNKQADSFLDTTCGHIEQRFKMLLNVCESMGRGME